MTLIEGATFTLLPDEPCVSLWENQIQTGLPGQGWHRYQILRVIRNDRPATYRIDMGHVSEWPDAGGFYIPGGVVVRKDGSRDLIPYDIPYDMISKIEVVHTVAELQDIANYKRMPDPTHLSQNLQPDMTIDKIVAHFEDQSNWARGKSTFGYGGQKIRNL